MRALLANSIVPFFAVALSSGPAFAQDASGILIVTGHVLDEATGEPVAAALVRVDPDGEGVLTGSDGAFRVENLDPGMHSFEISRLGYFTTRRPIEIRASTSLLFYLPARPIAMEQIEVIVDALEQRRRSVPHAVRAFGPRRLASAASLDLEQFLRQRSGLLFTSCRGGADRSCLLHRGSPVRLSLYVDESRVLGGMEMAFLHQVYEFHSIEVIPGCGMVRAYTRRFMESVAAGRRSLSPTLLPYCGI